MNVMRGGERENTSAVSHADERLGRISMDCHSVMNTNNYYALHFVYVTRVVLFCEARYEKFLMLLTIIPLSRQFSAR